MKAVFLFLAILLIGLFASYYFQDTLGQIAGGLCFVFSALIALITLDTTLERTER